MVSAIINISLVTRRLLDSVIYSDQFLPIKDNENTSKSSASSAALVEIDHERIKA